MKQGAPWLIVGLGNPGGEYRFTRHNMGFLVVELLADRWRVRMNKHKHQAVFGDGQLKGQRLLLAQPQTYMNLSGRSVSALMRWYKVPLSQLVVIYDDVDLPLGKIRLRPEGSAGTHNGMRSVIAELGSQQFPRVRVGIGRPPPGWELADFVLSRLTAEEQQIMMPALQVAADTAEVLLTMGLDAALRQTAAGNRGQL